VSTCTKVDKGARRGDIAIWNAETKQQVMALGAKQAPSLAFALGVREDPGGLLVSGHGKMSVLDRAQIQTGLCACYGGTTVCV